MKTTLEIPDPIFRRAKARAVQEGVPFGKFVADALSEKLATKSPVRKKAILKLAGGLRHLRKETTRINKLIEMEFEMTREAGT